MREEEIFAGPLEPPACHSPTLAELPDGTLYAVWYAGSYEGSTDTVLYGSARRVGDEWSPPRRIMTIPGLPIGNPVLWSDQSILHLYFVILYGDWWTDARLAQSMSTDGGQIWASPELLDTEPGLMLRTPPLRLDDGVVLLPAYRERHRSPMVLRSEDNGETWRLLGDTTARGKAIQPALVQLSDGRILMYTRTNQGRIYQSYSYNGGLSWTASQPTTIPNPDSSIDLLRSRGGALVLAFNDAETGRDEISVALSQNEGQTWPQKRLLAGGGGEYSYPTLLQSTDGMIHIVYTKHRATIVHAEFEISWIGG